MADKSNKPNSTTSTTVVVQESPKKEDAKVVNQAETTDTPARYLAYFARLRGLVAVNAAAASGMARYLAYTSDVGEAFRPVGTLFKHLSSDIKSTSHSSPFCLCNFLGLRWI